MDLSLHEINIPCNWPTEPGSDVPIRHVWHSCRPDLRDLLYKCHWIEDIDRVKDLKRWLKGIVAAVADGSRTPSPFFHVSKTSDGAYYFAERGQNFRGEHPRNQIFTRIDLLGLYQDGIIGSDSIIDISTHDAVRTLFRPLHEDYENLSGAEKLQLNKVLSRGPRDFEILLCWRGSVDPHYIIMMSKPPLCRELGCLGTVLEGVRGIGQWNAADVACINAAVRVWKDAFFDHYGCSHTPPEPDWPLLSSTPRRPHILAKKAPRPLSRAPPPPPPPPTESQPPLLESPPRRLYVEAASMAPSLNCEGLSAWTTLPWLGPRTPPSTPPVPRTPPSTPPGPRTPPSPPPPLPEFRGPTPSSSSLIVKKAMPSASPRLISPALSVQGGNSMPVPLAPMSKYYSPPCVRVKPPGTPPYPPPLPPISGDQPPPPPVYLVPKAGDGAPQMVIPPALHGHGGNPTLVVDPPPVPLPPTSKSSALPCVEPPPDKKPRPSKAPTAPTVMTELPPVIQLSSIDGEPPCSSGSSTPTGFPTGPLVLTAIFNVPGNDVGSMDEITETVFGLPFLSSAPTSGQISAEVVSNVYLRSEDDAQTAHSQENEALLPQEEFVLQQWNHLATASVYLELKNQLRPREYELCIELGKLEEKFMSKNSLIRRNQNAALYAELLASPDVRHNLTISNPFKKGYDPEVQAARINTSRYIDLSGAVGRADAARESNLAWFRETVRQLVDAAEFAPYLDTCTWLSSVVRDAARPIPVHSYDKSDLCPMLRGRPVDVLTTMGAIGAVEKLVQRGRKPPSHINETTYPMAWEDGEGVICYGQWFMDVLGFKVHVFFIGVSPAPLCRNRRARSGGPIGDPNTYPKGFSVLFDICLFFEYVLGPKVPQRR